MELRNNPGKQAMANVLEILNRKGWNKAELARRLNLSPAYVSNWCKRGLPSDRIKTVADILEVSMDAIAGRDALDDVKIPVTLSGKIPVVGYARLGDGGFYELCQIENEGELNIPSSDPSAYALRCEGTSMMPRIQPGEFVIAEPSFEAMPGDEVVVQSEKGTVMVKRYLYSRNGMIHLGSINSEHPEIILPFDEVRSIHPVLAIVPKKFLRKTF